MVSKLRILWKQTVDDRQAQQPSNGAASALETSAATSSIVVVDARARLDEMLDTWAAELRVRVQLIGHLL